MYCEIINHPIPPRHLVCASSGLNPRLKNINGIERMNWINYQRMVLKVSSLTVLKQETRRLSYIYIYIYIYIFTLLYFTSKHTLIFNLVKKYSIEMLLFSRTLYYKCKCKCKLGKCKYKCKLCKCKCKYKYKCK